MVLVTGGTGVMGREFVRRLLCSGQKVRVLTLPSDAAAGSIAQDGAEVVYGDISRRETIRDICRNCRTVFHCAAVIIAFDNRVYEQVNVNGTRNIVAEAGEQGIRHFVYVSSASVVYPKPTVYSLSKQRCEKIVRESGIPFTIIRPTLVYGKNGGGELLQFIDYLRRFPVVPFVGNGKAIKRPVWTGDIVEGFEKLSAQENGTGAVYNFSGDERISLLDFARLCLRLLGCPRKPIVHVPVCVCRVLAGSMGLTMKKPPLRWQVIAGMTQNADESPASAVQEIGYKPSRVSDRLPACFPSTG